jgi:hypothetical protein
MAAALQGRIHDGKACNAERPSARILWRAGVRDIRLFQPQSLETFFG